GLAREERHLAEEGRRAQVGDVRLLSARPLGHDLDRATEQHEERVAGVALATDDLAAAEDRLLEIGAQHGELGIVEIVEEVDLAKRAEALLLESIRIGRRVV